MAQVPSPLWVGIRNSAMTSHIAPKLEETSFTLPRRTPKPQRTTAPDPKKFARGSPQPAKSMDSPGTLPPRVGIRNSALNLIYRQGLKRRVSPYRSGPKNPRKLPLRTPRSLRRGLPSPVRVWVAQVPPPLWVGIRNSALTPYIQPKLEETSFTLPHRIPKPQKTTAPDPKKFAQGFTQSCQTTGSAATLPLMNRHPLFGTDPIHSQGL